MTTEETEVLNQNMGLIYKLANKFYGVEKEDLIQAGRMGVIKAYRNYKKNENAKFSSYIYKYILGEMYLLVENQRQIKVSRDVLKLYRLIEQTRYSVAQKWGRILTNEELAVYLQEDIVLIENAIMAGSIIVGSLDQASNEDRSLYETIPEQTEMSMEERLMFYDSLNDLSEEERQIIEYRYFEDLTQSEVARKLNMTQVMVSRYEKRGKRKIQTYYEEEE